MLWLMIKGRLLLLWCFLAPIAEKVAMIFVKIIAVIIILIVLIGASIKCETYMIGHGRLEQVINHVEYVDNTEYTAEADKEDLLIRQTYKDIVKLKSKIDGSAQEHQLYSEKEDSITNPTIEEIVELTVETVAGQVRRLFQKK